MHKLHRKPRAPLHKPETRPGPRAHPAAETEAAREQQRERLKSCADARLRPRTHRPLSLHPAVANAAEGRLPDWAMAGDDRRAHMERVSALMDSWADALGVEDDERRRWRAAGHLHDALRDADPDALRARVPPALQGLPGALLHGPAAAERLRIDGVEDGELLKAVAFHTVGSPRFRRLGRALYAADFLEPGRPYRPDWRAELRGRMPDELDAVVREVLRARIGHRLERGDPVLAPTMDFWNRLSEERA